MPPWLKRFLLIALKNAVNAVITNAGLMTMLHGAFNMYSRSGWWNLGKAGIAVVISREGMVWIPVLIKWSKTDAEPNGGV